MRLLLFNILCGKIKLAIIIIIVILNFNYMFFKNSITEYLSNLIRLGNGTGFGINTNILHINIQYLITIFQPQIVSTSLRVSLSIC